MASIALVHPLFLATDEAERDASSPYFPLGLLYLAAYVRDRGHDVAIFDGTFHHAESAFSDFLWEGSWDLVGFSSLVTTRETALRLAAQTAYIGVPVVFGGPDPTADPAAYLADPNVDLVVHHEGEQTIAHLLDLIDQDQLAAESLPEVPGIAWRSDGVVRVNQPRPPIENLDELPEPARDLIDMERYLHQWQQQSGYTSITVATGRGCPFGCSWCRDSVHGDGWRQRSAESVAAEVKRIKETWAVDSIRIVDDVDGMDPNWLDDWAAEANELDAVVPFEGLQRIDRDDLPMLEVRDSL